MKKFIDFIDKTTTDKSFASPWQSLHEFILQSNAFLAVSENAQSMKAKNIIKYNFSILSSFQFIMRSLAKKFQLYIIFTGKVHILQEIRGFCGQNMFAIVTNIMKKWLSQMKAKVDWNGSERRCLAGYDEQILLYQNSQV